MKAILNIRVEESTKIQIEELASMEGMTPSEYARNILIDNLPFEDEEDEEEDGEIINIGSLIIDCSTPFHKERQFILLVSWLFSKALFAGNVDNESFVSHIKKLVELAMIDYEFSNELRFEFLKVLNDINRYLIEPDSENKRFNFCTQDNLYSFNYSLLLKDVWKISQDD